MLQQLQVVQKTIEFFTHVLGMRLVKNSKPR